MKAYFKFLLAISSVLVFTACSSGYDSGFNANNNGSNAGGGSNNPSTPSNPIDDVTDGNACSDYTPIDNAYDSNRRHVYVGEFRLARNSNAQRTYRRFMGNFGKFCANNQYGEWQINPQTGQYEYVYGWYNGVANCSNWDDFMKVWISFPKNNPKAAHLVIESLMSGYPDGPNGQGYLTERIQLKDAQIDCSVSDKTVIYYEPLQGYQFKVNIYKGNKSSEFMRAEVFYQNASLGKSDFFIITD